MTPAVVLVHDYLSQRGGAERVALSMTRAFPSAPLFTSMFEPQSTFSGFSQVDVRTLGLNRIGAFRRHYRLAFPVLAPTFSPVPRRRRGDLQFQRLGARSPNRRP